MVKQQTDSSFIINNSSPSKLIASTRTRMGRSKDTSDIKGEPSPLKSCILIPNPDGSGEKLNMKKAKSVHFADSLGKPLKSVKSMHDFDDEFDFSLLTLKLGSNNSKTRHFFPVNNIVRNNVKNKDNITRTSMKGKFVNFEQPIADTHFVEKVKSENVLLENVIFRDHGIFGTVAVHNIAFEKRVYVKYTIDNWKTVFEADANYVPGSSTGVTDHFSFEINIKDQSLEEIEMKFAICFATDYCSYWDSNCGQNYFVLFRRYEKENKISDFSENYNGFILRNQNFIGWAS